MATRDEMTISRYGRGICPVCDTSIALLKNGTVRAHRAGWVWQNRLDNPERCRGAGQNPKEG